MALHWCVEHGVVTQCSQHFSTPIASLGNYRIYVPHTHTQRPAMRATLVHLNQSLTSSFIDRDCFVENQPKKCNFLMCSIFMPYHLSLRVSHTREGMFSFVRNEFEHVVTIALSKPSPTKLSKREQEKEWALATTNVPGQNNAYWGPHK